MPCIPQHPTGPKCYCSVVEGAVDTGWRHSSFIVAVDDPASYIQKGWCLISKVWLYLVWSSEWKWPHRLMGSGLIWRIRTCGSGLLRFGLRILVLLRFLRAILDVGCHYSVVSWELSVWGSYLIRGSGETLGSMGHLLKHLSSFGTRDLVCVWVLIG